MLRMGNGTVARKWPMRLRNEKKFWIRRVCLAGFDWAAERIRYVCSLTCHADLSINWAAFVFLSKKTKLVGGRCARAAFYVCFTRMHCVRAATRHPPIALFLICTV